MTFPRVPRTIRSSRLCEDGSTVVLGFRAVTSTLGGFDTCLAIFTAAALSIPPVE